MPATSSAVLAVTSTGHYLHWGVVSVSLTNLVIISIMVVVFVLALVVPFQRRGGGPR